MQRLLATCSILSLGVVLTAQVHGFPAPPPAPPPPPQAIPVTAPPVDHPAYAGQPLMPRSNEPTPPPPAPAPKAKKKKDKGRFVPPAGPVPGPAKPPAAAPAGPAAPAAPAGDDAEAAMAAAKKAADEFGRTKVDGRELRARIDKVLKHLHWNETLDGAAVEATASNKPIVWVQMLGDVDGFT